MNLRVWTVAFAVLFCAHGTWAEEEPLEEGLVKVEASEAVTISRNDGETPTKQKGLHPKKAFERESKFDRFCMIRFDSEDFGKSAKFAALLINAKDSETHEGKYRFRLYAVRDGDKEDEQFVEKDYDPAAEGTLFTDNASLIDKRQVYLLGTFTTERGEAVKFHNSKLTSFVRSDRNGTVTLVIIRDTITGENSTFMDKGSDTPPTLVLKMDEKAKPKAEPDPAPDAAKDEKPE